MTTTTRRRKTIHSVRQERQRILKNLNVLRSFPNTKTVRRLRSELKAKLAAIEKRIKRQGAIEIRRSKRQAKEESNTSRSNKLRKYHNYLRQIRNSYPEISYPSIRKMFKERKGGNDVDIPDVIWQNPSP